MVELLVVVAIVAIAAAAVAFSLRDPAAVRLEQEAERLAQRLEGARAEARASGLEVAWQPGTDGAAPRFVGLPPGLDGAAPWQHEGVAAQVVGAAAVILGPDALLPPQRIVLRLGDRRAAVATDGLEPFAVVAVDAEDEPR
ncbi:MAG: type II secretion system protein GspH [Rubrivivax sp.]|jgi:general secretion pathway protein H|nr:type II secretion system protein GspH [Rubrivivax sp.]